MGLIPLHNENKSNWTEYKQLYQWSNQWICVSFIALTLAMFISYSNQISLWEEISKYHSRKVSSFSGYICSASRQLFWAHKSNSYLCEWWNTEILKSPWQTHILCCFLCSNSVQNISGWSGQCACAVPSMCLRTLISNDIQWHTIYTIGSFI